MGGVGGGRGAPVVFSLRDVCNAGYQLFQGVFCLSEGIVLLSSWLRGSWVPPGEQTLQGTPRSLGGLGEGVRSAPELRNRRHNMSGRGGGAERLHLRKEGRSSGGWWVSRSSVSSGHVSSS